MTLFESGIRNRRTEFVPETTRGETPSNPAWELFSDRMINFATTPEVQYAIDQAVGGPDPAGIERGPEDHEVTVGYRLQRWLVDGSGNPQDAAGYGIVREADNELQSHTIVDREDRASGGDDGGGLRLYAVVKGAVVDTVGITLDPDSGEPVPVELTYTTEKIRSQLIHQPSSSTLLAVESTDAGDTTQTLTIEDEGAATSEGVALNGTTLVSTSSQFADIDAAELDAETVGDVNVYVNSGSATTPAKGTLLMTIRGSDAYDGIEGDLGVPALGTGSHAAALGTAFEKFLGQSIDRGGSGIATHIVAGEFEISNGLETVPRASTYRRVIQAGQREATLSADLIGEFRSHDAWVDHLRNQQENVVWNADGGTLQLDSATLTSAGERAIAPDEILLQDGSEFTAQGVTVS